MRAQDPEGILNRSKCTQQGYDADGPGARNSALRTRESIAMRTLDLAPQPGSRLTQRRNLTPRQIAGLLDERLYDPRLTLDDFIAGCRTAADAAVAAVVCPPSRVALAAHLLRPRGVKVAAMASLDPPCTPQTLGQALAQAENLLQDGATELGVLAPSAPLVGANASAFAKAVRRLTEQATGHQGMVKVLMPASCMTNDHLINTCRISIDSGAGMVQGGLWDNDDRASLTQIALMRRAIGEDALLKWSAPVANLNRLLIACAEGVDRFNADTTTILKQAADRARLTEIRIPEPGEDY